MKVLKNEDIVYAVVGCKWLEVVSIEFVGPLDYDLTVIVDLDSIVVLSLYVWSESGKN